MRGISNSIAQLRHHCMLEYWYVHELARKAHILLISIYLLFCVDDAAESSALALKRPRPSATNHDTQDAEMRFRSRFSL